MAATLTPRDSDFIADMLLIESHLAKKTVNKPTYQRLRVFFFQFSLLRRFTEPCEVG